MYTPQKIRNQIKIHADFFFLALGEIQTNYLCRLTTERLSIQAYPTSGLLMLLNTVLMLKRIGNKSKLKINAIQEN